jgi:hypothetical protein
VASRGRRLAVALLVAGAASGGREGAVVRIEATGSGGRHAVAVLRPSTNGREAPLAWVESLVPDPLPASSGSCSQRGSAELAIVFADGRSVRYADCLPRRIKWLRDSVLAEAGRWSSLVATPSVIVGARPAEARELRRLTQELGLTSLHRIEIKTLVRRMKLVIESVDTVRVDWEATLLARLYNVAAARAGLREIFGLRIGRSGGWVTDLGIGAPAWDLETVQRFVDRTDARIVELRTLAAAIAITVRGPNPAAFLKYHGRRFVRALRAPHANGTVVYAAGGLTGWGFVSPGKLDACGPIRHSFSRGSRPEPCPA